MVLEVANLICFLQGYLALTSGREPAHDVIPWPDLGGGFPGVANKRATDL